MNDEKDLQIMNGQLPYIETTTKTITQTLTLPNIEEEIHTILEQQRMFFTSGQTRDIQFRKEQLKKLKQALKIYESDILEALALDLSKPKFEAFFSEIAITNEEINYALKHLKKWMKPEKIKVPLAFFKASAKSYWEPRGITLIIGPWNYPFMLVFAPLVGAIAAGNTAVLKPSEVTPNCSKVLTKIIKETFNPEYITAIEGGPEVAGKILEQKYDYIFYTGGTRVGRIVMEAAAKHLTPLTLELGGKSPCIVDQNTNIALTAKRIVFGKFFNAGQTCVAPDYLLVHKSIKNEFVTEIKKSIENFYGSDAKQSPHLARIVNERHFDRLNSFLETLDSSNIVIGGQTDRNSRYIAPTVIHNVTVNDDIMKEEIFGPLLPIIEYENIEDSINYINSHPHPLALYVFSKDKKLQKKIFDRTTFGGGITNDSIVQFGYTEFPIGGIGDSGMGIYHGKESFRTFSQKRGIINYSTRIDPFVRYPPYNSLKERIVRLLFR